MTSKSHYLMTLGALVLLLLLTLSPHRTSIVKGRSCSMNRGKLECLHVTTENRINLNSEVSYKFN